MVSFINDFLSRCRIKGQNKKDTLYIDLMKRVLIDFHRLAYPEYKPLNQLEKECVSKEIEGLEELLDTKGYHLCREISPVTEHRINGLDWPTFADSMIGLKRMSNIEFCIDQIIDTKVEGDFIETGVWRGGACIFMKAMLRAYKIDDRVVWVADSFNGLPAPNAIRYPADEGDNLYMFSELKVDLTTVQENFQKYGLLDDNVRFLKGWFSVTLPNADIDKIALLRLDGDMYESTMDALTWLYPKLSVGGYVIIDDWGAIEACRKAVLDFRTANQITEKIVEIDWTGVYWKKENLQIS